MGINCDFDDWYLGVVYVLILLIYRQSNERGKEQEWMAYVVIII